MRNDARILKTLLLAALVPEVEALKALTGKRLAALNHGTVAAPLPGTEGRLVLAKCREWAAEVGEIKITEELNPVISIQISGVDTDPIIAAAKAQDNPGNRRRKIREMLFESLKIADTNDLFSTYALPWRSTRREVEVIYDNVREMTDGPSGRGRRSAQRLIKPSTSFSIRCLLTSFRRIRNSVRSTSSRRF